ncbi:MAG TPA: c-type cytochrome, partial [Gemmatales bacterium]|nr:c-type cytochrome [Gemmatales bacterium]
TITKMLAKETSPQVIREAASSLAQWSKQTSVWGMLKALVEHQLVNDPVIPQLLWLALEREMQRGSEPILSWLQSANQPIVVNYLLPRVMRRMAAEGKVEQITQALQFISKLKDAAKVQQALGGLATALEGRQVKDVAAWKETRTILTATNNADVNRLVLKLSASFYDSAAVAQSLDLLKQPGDGSEKLEAIRYLALLKEQQAMPILLSLITSTGSDEVKLAAARGLSSYSQGDVPGRILAGWKDYSPALRAELITTLRSRKPWARELLQALGKKTIARSDLNDNVALAIRQFNDAELNKLLDQHYGTFRDSPAELDALIVKLRKELPTLQGDVTRGKAVFTKHCMQCHKFEGQGHDVGPVLDGAERTREYLLANVVDPNRVVGTPYFTRTIVLKNGKLLTGILVEEDATTLRLKRENAIIEVVVKADIEEQKTSTKSLMPEGLSNNMTVQDLRDLFQYLEVPPKPTTKEWQHPLPCSKSARSANRTPASRRCRK